MKKQIALAVAAVFITTLFTGFAQAGPGRHSSHHHRPTQPHHPHHKNNILEGVVLGAGALILGTAIAQSLNNPCQTAQVHAPPVSQRPGHWKHHKKKGHWEIQKIWVEPVYETRWNPAHYNARGKWVQGRRQQFLVAKGFWKKERVWVKARGRY
nr:hypothetical protein [uncultured Desulfobacter sp.]